MAKEIVWNREALNQYNTIQNYLLSESNYKIAKSFNDRFFNFLEILSAQPEIGSIEFEAKGIRGFLVHKYTKIFYKIDQDKIYLLSVFDTRQDSAQTNFE